MITVSILEDSDTILPSDYCRPLQLISMDGGHSDYFSFENAYSGSPENNVKWTRVEQVFGDIWFGEPVWKINEDCKPYEFIRGNIPESHLYGKTRREKKDDYDEYLKSTAMHCGKYKEMLLYTLVTRYPDYAVWAENKGIIKSERDFL